MATITKEYVEGKLGFKIQSFTQTVIKTTSKYVLIKVVVVPVVESTEMVAVSNTYYIQVNNG